MMMNLERNLIDNILECQVKIGYDSLPVTFYYPREELADLLGCEPQAVEDMAQKFKSDTLSRLGDLKIAPQSNDKNRFAVTVGPDGLTYVNENYKPSDFIKAFISEIKNRKNSHEDMVKFFHCFSDNVIIEKENEDEWAIYFEDEKIDPYVYFIERNAFGLEYHRFTHSAYSRLKEN